ncbi:putative lung seven transmembrane receptor [Lyophyllum shimeji]|uniref:Lung seven transmembrane receptor n=1 Tax=Lyophyllum shimeji TaxID=47721 RepID=A0A9P3PH12_LYOSH|nr:putative lung seven transmembrane receptor [Lyophyllum shimeji]
MVTATPAGRILKLVLLSFFFVLSSFAYEVPIRDTDYSRQICSGMWASQSTFINVSFDAASQGQVAMVIYEWADAKYLGKSTNPTDDYLPKTYVCTARAVTEGTCTKDQLGRFILDLPSGKPVNETSFWSARVELPSKTSTNDASGSGFWDNPAGNPTPPPSDYTSPWRRRPAFSYSPSVYPRQTNSSGPDGLYAYTEPIVYPVRRTGYYCVAVVPVTATSPAGRAATDVPYHPSYTGRVLFRNTFDGKLPASDYPKVNFYLAMSLIYAIFAAGWAWLCYQHLHELLPIQNYLSTLVGLLVIEMVANWAYYRYLNSHGKSTASTVFLIVVAILDAARNAMSFFMLLVVSLGLSVVRESLGRTMWKCQILAGAHFIFGILYAVGIVELELESTSALVLLMFVIPLAFTLSGFLLWIMYSLNATIAQLRARKQRYKLRMFERLYYILLAAVVVIAIFFVVSSMSFSGRLAEDYAAKSWRSRWWLLDGWLALLYFAAFVAIAFLWRPSANNRRLAMSDEIAQDEEDAEDYDLEALQNRTRARDDDDNATLVGGGRGGQAPGDVVFEIGEEDPGSDGEDDVNAKKRRLSDQNHRGEEHERQGLMGSESRRRDD